MCVLSGSWFELVCPALSTAFGFCSSSNELWKPWLQLEGLIATEGGRAGKWRKRPGQIMCFFQTGQDRPRPSLGGGGGGRNNGTGRFLLIPSAALCMTLFLMG